MQKVLKVAGVSITIGLVFGLYLYFAYDKRTVRIILSVLYSVNIGSLMMLVIYGRNRFLKNVDSQLYKVVIVITLLIAVAIVGTEITLFIQNKFLYRIPHRFMNGNEIYVLNIIIVLVTGIPILYK